MNLELIKRNSFEADGAEIAEIVNKMKLHPKLVEMLFCRGINSESAIKKYLTPNKDNFHDPFLLKGMAEAVKRINQAIENKERVIIYGDYDADGICAAAIFSLYLSECGLDVFTHIPSRSSEGYGLNVESLERIIEQACPDLIITCDCGISGHKEVEFAQDLGVDVIVTDHHEIAEVIPDCIVVNPKLPDCNYPIDNLCGAGVVLKVVQALGGIERALAYLDLAAVATIADLVPLLDENRLIVQLGLAEPKKMNKGLRSLILNQQIDGVVTSGDIAYKIAPRINAAGRMGDAYRAFELLTTNDLRKIDEIIKEINDDNEKRKKLCDEMYNEALDLIRHDGVVESRAVVLSHPSWEKGITGILAARIAGDFKRPSFILVNANECYKGTSRSIIGINIHELLSSMSDILIEFGGHSQAAGFSILKENISQFKERINKYLEGVDPSLFMPSIEYDMQIDLSDINTELVSAISKMEPTGNSNPRPVFKVCTQKLDIAPCKNNYNHTNIMTESGLQIMAFNFYNENQYLLGAGEKELALELSLNNYGNRESVRAVLRTVKPSALYINDKVAKASYLNTLRLNGDSDYIITEYDFADFENLIDNNMFGTLYIAGSEKTYNEINAKIGNRAIVREFLYSPSLNNYSKIAVAPVFDDSMMFSNYSKIIFADAPIFGGVIKYLRDKSNAQIFVPKNKDISEFLDSIELSREVFSRYYEAIRNNEGLTASNIFTYFKMLSNRIQGLELNQFIVCAAVFTELDFITQQEVSGFKLIINKGVKRELAESDTYQYLLGKINNK